MWLACRCLPDQERRAVSLPPLTGGQERSDWLGGHSQQTCQASLTFRSNCGGWAWLLPPSQSEVVRDIRTANGLGVFNCARWRGSGVAWFAPGPFDCTTTNSANPQRWIATGTSKFRDFTDEPRTLNCNRHAQVLTTLPKAFPWERRAPPSQ